MIFMVALLICIALAACSPNQQGTLVVLKLIIPFVGVAILIIGTIRSVKL